MKIENRSDNTNINPHLNRVQDTAERQESKGPTPAHEASVDRLELSGAAKALQQARQLLDALPEVRLEKVTELKGLIQQGEYNVKGEAVAAKMLGQGLFDRLV